MCVYEMRSKPPIATPYGAFHHIAVHAVLKWPTSVDSATEAIYVYTMHRVQLYKGKIIFSTEGVAVHEIGVN